MERAEMDMAKRENKETVKSRDMTQTQINEGEFSAFGHVSKFFQPYVWYWKITTWDGKAGLFMVFWDLRACFATDDGAVTWGKWIWREKGLLINNDLLIDAFTGKEFIPRLDRNSKLTSLNLDPTYRVEIPTLAEDPEAWLPITLTKAFR